MCQSYRSHTPTHLPLISSIPCLTQSLQMTIPYKINFKHFILQPVPFLSKIPAAGWYLMLTCFNYNKKIFSLSFNWSSLPQSPPYPVYMTWPNTKTTPWIDPQLAWLLWCTHLFYSQDKILIPVKSNAFHICTSSTWKNVDRENHITIPKRFNLK